MLSARRVLLVSCSTKHLPHCEILSGHVGPKNRCLRAYKCSPPCDTFSYKYEKSSWGLKKFTTSGSGFREETCTTGGVSSCLRHVSCSSGCLAYAHCVDLTGAQSCLRPVPCYCEGKYKFISALSGVRLVTSTSGFTVKRCSNGCLDFLPCQGTACQSFERCNGTGCFQVVSCSYIPPPDPCSSSALRYQRSSTGVQYIPVDGSGVSIHPCPSGQCYQLRQCSGSSDGLQCYQRIACNSGTALRCLKESFCSA